MRLELAGDDPKRQIGLIVFGKYGGLIWIGRVIADGYCWAAAGLRFSLMMGKSYAAKITAIVFSVDLEVEPGFDLVGDTR